MTLSERLRELAARVVEHGGRILPRADELAKLLAEIDAKFGYELAMLEQQNIREPNTRCGYVIAGIRDNGDFSKWTKVIQAPHPSGAYLFYQDQETAEQAWRNYDEALHPHFRVFPCVLIAGTRQAQ